MDLNVQSDIDQVGQILVRNLLETSNASILQHGNFILGISGGSLLQILAQWLPLRHPSYPKWWIFFVDERIVPHESSDSNYGEAFRKIFNDRCAKAHDNPSEQLLEDATLKLDQICRLTEIATDDPVHTAQIYEKTFREFFEKCNGNGYATHPRPPCMDRGAISWPVFDCLLLGMVRQGLK